MEKKYKTKLVDGWIPAFTDCPYKDECLLKRANLCIHRGAERVSAFSCTCARIIELCKKKEK